MSMHSRRKFFQFALGAGSVALLAPWMKSALAGDGPAAAALGVAGLKTATRTSYAFGTDISMLAMHEDEQTARMALNAAFEELETVESVMSIYRPQSQISKLNRDGVFHDPHPYFVDVLKLSLDLSRRSGGAFDVTVQPLWELYMAAKKKNALPGAAEIEAARRKVDWKKIECSRSKIQLGEKGMAMTLNGIAQGFAADRCADALKKYGIRHALLNTGEIHAMGSKPGNSPWIVGIQHPRKHDAYVGLAKLDSLCLATSGDYATTFSDDFVYNHIFDPATGRSPLTFSSVTVTAKEAQHADGLSSAVCVVGLERGLKLIEETPGGSALLVFKDGRTLTTKNFPLAS